MTSLFLRGRVFGAVAAAAPAPTPTPSPTPTPTPSPADYTATNQTELNARLTDAYNAGGNKVIELLPGSYGDWSPTSRTMPAPVTIRAQSLTSRSTFHTISASGFSNVIIDGIELSCPDAPLYYTPVGDFTECNDLTLQNMKVRGAPTKLGRLLRFFGGSNLKLLKNDIQNAGDIAVLLSQNNGIRVINPLIKWNSIRFGEEDCIRVMGVQGGTIEANYLGHSKFDTGDHADGIQVTQDPTTPLNSTLTIKNNLIAAMTAQERGLQGIIFTNANVSHGAATIDGNTTINCAYNAIAPGDAPSGLVIQNNKIYDRDFGDALWAWLGISNSAGVIQTNNRVTLNRNGENIYQVANTTFTTNDAIITAGMTLDTAAQQAVIDAWLASFPNVPLLPT